jgi:hypothetical protein
MTVKLIILMALFGAIALSSHIPVPLGARTAKRDPHG